MKTTREYRNKFAAMVPESTSLEKTQYQTAVMLQNLAADCNELEDCVNALVLEADKTRAERDAALAERDHWKANHDNQVAIKSAVLGRPDLGDRAARVRALIACTLKAERERDSAIARAEKELEDHVKTASALGSTVREREELRARAEKAERERDALAARVRELEAGCMVATPSGVVSITALVAENDALRDLLAKSTPIPWHIENKMTANDALCDASEKLDEVKL